ncbi:MAG: sigma-54 interaction domain-containing protein [Planctomycetota bacterium]
MLRTDPREDTLLDGALVGQSEVMRDLAARARRAAESDLPVLIHGQTGTGKELLARAIHAASARREEPFVSEACGALPDGLLESELFGHEAGAYTGAEQGRAGMFERADGGTLFIDELGDANLKTQAKLLRVLQEGEVRRLGGKSAAPVDVRLIASTQRDLAALVREGGFRRDLLFRVAVVELHVPPLRARLEDVPLLATHVLRRFAAELGRPGLRLSEGALDKLVSHDWPGNVRELENAVRVGALFSRGDVIGPDVLSLVNELAPVRAAGAADEPSSYQELLDHLSRSEREYVEKVLADCRHNKALAARTLGITRYAFYRVLKRLGLDDADAPLPEPELVGSC